MRKVRIDFDACIEPIEAAELDRFVAAGLITAAQRERLGTLDELKPSIGGDGKVIGPSQKHAALFRMRYLTGPPPVVLAAVPEGHAHRRRIRPTSRNIGPSIRTFPNESTLNQVFDEAQWESYRGLGDHVASPLFEDPGWFWAIPL